MNTRKDNGGPGGRATKAAEQKAEEALHGKAHLDLAKPNWTTTQLIMAQRERVLAKRLARYERDQKVLRERHERRQKALAKKLAATSAKDATVLDVPAAR